MAATWELLGSATYSSGTTVTLASIPNKKYLRVEGFFKSASGNAVANMRFNSDGTSGAYPTRQNIDYGTDAAYNSRDEIETFQASAMSAGEACWFTIDILNISNQEKVVRGICTHTANGTGAGDTVRRSEFTAKWNDKTEAIDEINFINNDTGTLSTDSRFTVWGADDQTVTAKDKSTITNVPAGTRYEETDTRKIFRRKGASSSTVGVAPPSGLGDKCWDMTNTSSVLRVEGEMIGTGNTSISFWCYPITGATGQESSFLKHWSASGTNASGTYSVIFNITESGNKVNFAVTSGSSQWSTARTSGGELQENKWNLVTCTFNTSNSSNSGIKIYINGSEPSDDSGYPTGASVTSIAQSDDFAVGASGQSGSPSGTVEDFDGYMMDFATWNTTLSLSDHQSLWNSYNQTTNAGGALATTVSNNNIIAYYSGITGGGTPANESTGSASGGTNMNVTSNTNVAEAGVTSVAASWAEKGTA